MKSKHNTPSKNIKKLRKLQTTHIFFVRKAGAVGLYNLFEEENVNYIWGVQEQEDKNITFTTMDLAVSVREKTGDTLLENFTEIGRGQLMGEINSVGIIDKKMQKFLKKHPQYAQAFEIKLDEIVRKTEELEERYNN